MTKIGRNIKTRRIALGIPVQKLADATGLSRATIYRYENGKIKKMPFDSAISFAKILKCPVDDFLDGDDLIDYKIKTINKLIQKKMKIEDDDDTQEVINIKTISLTAQKSEPLPKISDARPQSIGEMSHEEENLIRMYRAEMYGDIITLMVDKMKEKGK